MSEIVDDKRPIRRIDWDDKDGSAYIASDRCTIESYAEEGQMAYVAYFRVKQDGVIVARVPAWKVTVTYA
jgi:hypothetical protein